MEKVNYRSGYTHESDEDLNRINALNNLIINTSNIKKYHTNSNKYMSKDVYIKSESIFDDHKISSDFVIYYLLYYYDEDKMTWKYNRLTIFEKKYSDKIDITEFLENDFSTYACGGVSSICLLLLVDKRKNELHIDRYYGTNMDNHDYDHMINENYIKKMLKVFKKQLFEKLMKQQQEREKAIEDRTDIEKLIYNIKDANKKTHSLLEKILIKMS